MIAAFTPILKQLMIDGILSGGRALPLPRINPTGLVILWFSAVLAMIAIGFLLVAEYMLLTTMYSPALSALLVSATAIGMSLTVAGTGLIVMRKQGLMSRRAAEVQRAQHHQPDVIKTITDILDTLGDELEGPIRDNPKTALMVASLAGFLAGDHRH